MGQARQYPGGAAGVTWEWCDVCRDKVDGEGQREPPHPSLCWRCRRELKMFWQRAPRHHPFHTELARASAFVDMKLRERHQKWWRRLARKFRR